MDRLRGAHPGRQPAATNDPLERMEKAEVPKHRNGMPGAIDTENLDDEGGGPGLDGGVEKEAAHQTAEQESASALAMPQADPDVNAEFETRHLDADAAFDAARFLSGRPRVAAVELRNFVWEEDGDVVAAALRAYGMADDDQHRQALRGVLLASGLEKADAQEDAIASLSAPDGDDKKPRQPTSIDAVTASGDDVAALVAHAFKHGDVESVALRGKHSHGSQVVRDEKTGEAWLLKPGSGEPSPAKGIANTKGSQSAREACFYACAKAVFGLEQSLPRCELLLVDGKPVAVMRFLPPEFRSLEDRARENSMSVLWTLHAYAKTGTLFKWAVMDWVLGQIDRHGRNLMADNGQPERVYLIDHGSTFAGPDFDPAHDRSSFVPYYLRAWSPRRFNTLPPAEKLRRMPRADAHVEVLLRDWVSGLHADTLAATCNRYGLDPRACVDRLARLRALCSDPEVKDISEAIDALWVGAPVEQ